MTHSDFRESFNATFPEMTPEALLRRYNFAYDHTRKDHCTDSALAAVNELLKKPLTYEELKKFFKQNAPR